MTSGCSYKFRSFSRNRIFNMKEIKVLFVLILSWRITQPLKLPDYMKPCHRNAPDVNDCILKTARGTIPHIINGDPKYKIPSLDPVLIEELIIDQGSSGLGIRIATHDAYLRGMKDVDIKDMKLDFEKRRATFEWYFPELRLDCIYNVNGKILQLPIEGHGNGTILIKKVNAHYEYDWEMMKKKDSKEYYKVTKAKLTFTPEGFHINLENLFNGNKLLGDNMNRFMNENWRDILQDIGPAVADALGEYLRQVLNNIYGLVPVENVFILDAV